MSELTKLKESIDLLREQVKTLQSRLDVSESKNPRDLNVLIDNLNKDNKWCKLSLNNREQYVRNWCVRIVGLSVPQSYIDNYGVDGGCIRYIYERLIYPTLLCATPDEIKELGLDAVPQLDKVPEMFQVLENAHFLSSGPRSKNNKKVILPPVIIARFCSRWMRNLFLRLKRNHMPKPSDAEVARGISYYSVTPDLTSTNHHLLANLRSDSKVKSVWSIDGRIRFCLESDHKTVYQDNDVLCPVEAILASCPAAVQGNLDLVTSLIGKPKQSSRGSAGSVAGPLAGASAGSSAACPPATPGSSPETWPEVGGEERAKSQKASVESSKEVSKESTKESSKGTKSPVRAEMRGGSRHAPIGQRPGSRSRAEIEIQNNK